MSKFNNFIEKFIALPKYSFSLVNGGVRRVEDTVGGWVDRHSVYELIEDMQEEINRLNSTLEDITKNAVSRGQNE